jgi:hypothetical protein
VIGWYYFVVCLPYYLIFLNLFVVLLCGWVRYEKPILFFVMAYFLYVDMVSGTVSAACPSSIVRPATGDKPTVTSS